MSKRSVGKHAALLRHCSSSKALSAGQLLHDSITRDDALLPSLLLSNLLIHMYGSCGALQDARSTFDYMPHRNIFSWNLIMAAYLVNGHASDSFSTFRSLHSECLCSPDCVTFATAVSACAHQLAFSEGLWLHQLILFFGFECHVVVATALLTMYGRCGRIKHALWTFDNLPERNSCSWNAMLGAWAQHGDVKGFHQFFLQMMQEGMLSDRITCISTISIYTSHGSLFEGKRLHASLIGSSYEADATLQNALISFYGRCGNKENATSVFHAIQDKNLITWNAIIAAFAQAQKSGEVMESFARMQLEAVAPDEVTFSSVFSSFSGEFVLCEAKFLHACVAGCAHELDVVVQTALITMYGNCGRTQEAQMVFDATDEKDVAVWNAMVSAYSQHGDVKASISLFCDMLAEGQTPDKVTFIALLSVCADEAAIAQGSWIHEHMVSCSINLDLEIGNSLVNMYGRCGSLEDALEVFCRMPEHNLVSWSSVIMLYAQHNLTEEALRLFEQMLAAGISPDKVIFLCTLPMCANEAALVLGRKVHHCVVLSGFDTDSASTTALLNMYSKCGSIEEARRMFNLLAVRVSVSWNSLIAAHAHHGNGMQAILCYDYMISHGSAPDECTFYSVLSACSHAGLLEEGLWYFAAMVQQCLIVPTVEHFNCMIDLFGRAGQLEAVDFVLKSMGLQPSGPSWVTLLGACRVHLDISRGEEAAAELFDVTMRDVTPSVLLSNIYRAMRFGDNFYF